VRRADRFSRGVLRNVVWLSVISKPQPRGGIGPVGALKHKRKYVVISEWLCGVQSYDDRAEPQHPFF